MSLLKNGLVLMAEKNILAQSVDLHAVHVTDGSVSARMIQAEFETCSPGEFVTHPSMRLDYEAAQALFNDLWYAGFRPQDGTGNQSHMQAMQAHLDDMRKIVFNCMRIDPKTGHDMPAKVWGED